MDPTGKKRYGSPACSQGPDGIPAFEKFRKFERIYEPSGVQQLPDGRFAVVEDEAGHPLDVISLHADGQVSETPLFRSSLFSWSSPNRALNTLEDLEAVAVVGDGRYPQLYHFICHQFCQFVFTAAFLD